MLNLIKHGLSFHGRTGRLGYWLFHIFYVLITSSPATFMTLWAGPSVLATLKSGDINAILSSPDPKVMEVMMFLSDMMMNPLLKPILYILGAFMILLFIMMIATNVRRLHDFNLSGWVLAAFWGTFVAVGAALGAVHYFLPTASWLLPAQQIILIVASVANLIYYFIMLFIPGTKGTNKYGGDEREVKQYIKQRRLEIKAKKLEQSVHAE